MLAPGLHSANHSHHEKHPQLVNLHPIIKFLLQQVRLDALESELTRLHIAEAAPC